MFNNKVYFLKCSHFKQLSKTDTGKDNFFHYNNWYCEENEKQDRMKMDPRMGWWYQVGLPSFHDVTAHFFMVLQSHFYDKVYHSSNFIICITEIKYTVNDPRSWLYYLTQHLWLQMMVSYMKQNILELSSKIPIETSLQEDICHFLSW